MDRRLGAYLVEGQNGLMMFDPVHTIGTHLPRLVAPLYPDMLWRMPDHDKVAYLTFDDGPTASGTAILLDILDRYDAAATFFLLGRHAQRDPGLVKAMAEAGHTLGNHTFSHPNALRTPTPTLFDELNRTTDLLEDLCACSIRWMRPPYGYFTRPMRRWCQENTQRLTMWDVGLGDFLARTTSRQIEHRLYRSLRPGSIIVLHDNPAAGRITPRALSQALPRLRDEGWRFVAL